jgi:hypothetical protein
LKAPDWTKRWVRKRERRLKTIMLLKMAASYLIKTVFLGNGLPKLLTDLVSISIKKKKVSI